MFSLIAPTGSAASRKVATTTFQEKPDVTIKKPIISLGVYEKSFNQRQPKINASSNLLSSGVPAWNQGTLVDSAQKATEFLFGVFGAQVSNSL